MSRLDAVVDAVGSRRRVRRAVALVLVGLVAVVYVETTYPGDPDRLNEADAYDGVSVDRDGNGDGEGDGDGDVVIRGDAFTADTVGIVFYPGARVHPESYAWTFAPLVADRDVVVVIPEMPLHLAVLDSNAANGVRDRYEEIDRWVVGGHSLGGAMACRYAASNPDRVVGVVLFAAYCDDGDDLRGSGLPVLSVQGTADGVVDAETERANRPLLGSDATVVEIDGMNHAQFGAYGDQRGDADPTIDDETARDRLLAVLDEWLETSIDARTRHGTSIAVAETSSFDARAY